MKRFIVDQLRTHLADNQLLAPQQHGCIPNRLITTNLFQCELVINQYLNLKQLCNLITIDICRACDKISHTIVSQKLLSIGVRGKLHGWLLNFLSPHASTVWNGEWKPFSAGLVRDLEKVQRQFTKRLRCLSHLAYEDCLARLNVELLEARRLCANLLSVYNEVLNNTVSITPVSIGLRASQHQLEVQKLIL